ncbi:VC1465 family Xer recombination activation factor [Rhodanobacter ginsengisoli]|uniref:VC1465 family Xer recombination activation factor n=1 Tax=Rhodanobacter ginsengisoli TaxID=418646 RepID=A0ABW0QNH9_9GAMM
MRQPPAVIHYAKSRKARRRVWHISPEGFRELRHTCLLSRQRAADYLGVSVRTIRHWDAGRNRVPWSVVRLLRIVRSGELGGLHDAWDGWTINRLGLCSPCGRLFTVESMRLWWLTVEQARFWRQGYDVATRPSAGESVPAAAPVRDGDPLLIAMPGRRADTLPASTAVHASAHSCQTALDRGADERAKAAASGQAAGAGGGRAIREPACANAVGLAQWIGVDSVSGCTLPRDVILTSSCSQETAETVANSLISGFTPLQLGERLVVVGPDTNRGQKHPYGPHT